MVYLGRLPAPTDDAWRWQLKAACRGMESSYFFHPWNERGPEREARIERAKQVCQMCPVLRTCAKYDLDVKEPYGIWGGLSEEERDVLMKTTRRKPRKTPLVVAPTGWEYS